MLQESLARRYDRAHRPEASHHRGDEGATTSEYLVIAGVVVAIVLAVAGTFRTEILNAITILGCQISAGAGGGTGSCGGGATTAGGSAGSPAGTGRSSGGTNPGQPLRPGQLVQVAGPLPSNTGVPGGPAGPGGAGPNGPGVNPASLAGRGAMAPGGPTVTPGFGTRLGVLGSLSPSAVWNAAGEVKDTLAGAVPNPLPGGSPGLPVKDTVNATTARYGNWIGAGWWGGSQMDDKVGAMPPEDALDALGQAHDFGYGLADEAERLYGPAEGNRIRALADEIGYRAWQQLNPDPTTWVPPPKNLAAARDYYNRFPTVMQGMGRKHDQERIRIEKEGPPPTPAQVAALRARGPMTAQDVSAAAQDRIAQWNVDRGVSMRNNRGIR